MTLSLMNSRASGWAGEGSGWRRGGGAGTLARATYTASASGCTRSPAVMPIYAHRGSVSTARIAFHAAECKAYGGGRGSALGGMRAAGAGRGTSSKHAGRPKQCIG
eukprot:354704-Chlamydomonas_euryale.AAC.10